MPHFSHEPGFLREYQKLTQAQRDAFMAAIRKYIVIPMKAGNMPDATIFHKMSGYEKQGIYEFRWDPTGRLRATCTLFVDAAHEPNIHWRRIGSHDDVYKNP